MRRLPQLPVPLDERLLTVFGALQDPMTEVEARAQTLFPGQAGVIVWEGDAQTFQFSYVGQAAEALLGYPCERWIREPSFWADVVVHGEDRADAVAYCALATARARDHRFEYRARTADGRILWLRDFVQVIRGKRGVPERLRGIMFDITAERGALDGANDRDPREAEQPSRDDLQRERPVAG